MIINTKIPTGQYCYDENGVCPFWSKHPEHGYQNDGHCSLKQLSDWEDNTLLWDQVKECGFNIEEAFDEYSIG